MKKTFGAASAAIVLMLAWQTHAVAEDIHCPPSLGPVTVDNVIVRAGRLCTLSGTDVQGNVKVKKGGDLRIRRHAGSRTNAFIAGNVQAKKAQRVRILRGTHVDGDVQIKETRRRGSRPTVTIVRSMIGGDVQLEENRGGIRVQRNIIDGNLQCEENARPIRVAGNVVDGEAEGQCD